MYTMCMYANVDSIQTAKDHYIYHITMLMLVYRNDWLWDGKGSSSSTGEQSLPAQQWHAGQ